MKKQIRRAMLATVAMMLMGIVSLTGVTYAWFSQSDTASVEGMQLGIESKDGGVLMSAVPNPGASGWAYMINLDWVGVDFKPASTAPSNLTAGDLVFYDGVINEAKTYMVATSQLAAAEELGVGQSEAQGYYVKKTIYFNNVEDNDIKVSLGANISGDTTEGKSGLKNVDQAMRVAIVTHGTYTINSETGTNTAATTVAPDKSCVMIYEPEANKHHRGGEGYIPTYGVIKGSDGQELNFMNDKNDPAYATSEIKKIESGTETSEYIEKIDSYYAAKAGKQAPTFTIPANSYYKVTIYIWLEGQDVDCTNEISGSDLQIAVSFKKETVEAAAQ